MRGLGGKVAVVVGGAGGIGTATCTRLAEEGCAVVVGDLDDAAAILDDENTLDLILSTIRSPRVGKPDDIAAMVAFLASDDGEWINGQVISVDGGTTMR